MKLVGDDCGNELVVVGSPKARLPRLEQPDRAMAAATRLTIATAPLGARREKRILIKLTRTQVLNTRLNLGR